ncbi:germination protein YpeB [Alicyclobacillus fastidiosus]|uniref:Germination protein YpeB n=1 Tax=Alicyclobacillus fastidiosus TaxID=392011 RepID=A0ABY6ZA34_9BACL|nr:PepSY1/2 domain-containing protein [Alicyclobacillus fastidiosus]WAH39613.1 germination protein YpeB [Alicyclobacillus fastidiosus]GMA60820.1 germination protein YpeB [Alicyclobacillus fastidiosus]
MLHRATWVSAGILAVVAVGTTVGYWGYDQKQQKDAFARSAETQYESSFHSLVNDVRDMRKELAKSMLTQDHASFDTHLSSISRLCYAGEASLGRLPSNITPASHLQSYLHLVDNQVQSWMKHDKTPADKDVRKQLNNLYTQSGTFVSQLGDMQSQLGDKMDVWLAARHSPQGQAGFAADGLRRVDRQVASFADNPTTRAPKPSALANQTFAKEPTISSQAAIKKVSQVIGVKPTGWTAKLYRAGTLTAYYGVTGNAANNHISAEVSQRGGHLLTYYNDHAAKTSKYDFATAASDAAAWLKRQGFSKIERTDAMQYDHAAMFTFAPLVDGVPVIGQPISVHIALDNGQVVGFNAAQVYANPVGAVPPPKLTVAQLRKRLSPDFDVKIARKVIVQDENRQYIPAVAFYGTMKQETYCINLSAIDGAEVKIDQLT